MAGEIYLAKDTELAELKTYIENKTTTLYINNPVYDIGWDLKAAIPYAYQNYGNNCVAYKDTIYMFGSTNSSTYYQYLFKYNIKTNTWTTDTSKMSSAGVYGNGSSVIRIDNIAYVFGSYSAGTVAWKYDLDTDTITKLSTAIPFNFYYGAAVLDDNGKIHLLGGSGSNRAHYIYDPSTDTYTSSVTLPYNFYYGTACCVNSTIYAFGSGSSSSYYKYCYTFENNATAWAAKTSSPYNTYNGRAMVSADNRYIYIFGGTSNLQYLQTYDILNNTWSYVSTYIPFSFQIGGLVKYNSAIYVIGGSSDNTTMYKYKLRQKQFIKAGVMILTESELCYIKNSQEIALEKNINGLYEIIEDAYYYFDAEAQLTIIQ